MQQNLLLNNLTDALSILFILLKLICVSLISDNVQPQYNSLEIMLPVSHSLICLDIYFIIYIVTIVIKDLYYFKSRWEIYIGIVLNKMTLIIATELILIA